MQLEVGGIYEGKVTGITKFGAFVSFEGGQTGMVHISEIASTFVNEIKDFISEGQMVTVKVLSITEEGKVSLSIKKANPDNPSEKKSHSMKKFPPRKPRPAFEPDNGPARPGDFEWQDRSAATGSFEDMMSKFKQTSDEKMSDLKRSNDTRRGYSRKGR